ncbi:OmpA family protein [Winogradskyella jejuensis]|uniref:OmpA family protein n=1 Tax=Winogradskyella jejuensis TaxID=1089305 RepID=A0A1M5PPV7_9FLAO|nr:OmpA family protein [Winogradskyella jejuensis]SHH03569.1 OmpA family protein [Winogradskyella jejuensis]
MKIQTSLHQILILFCSLFFLGNYTEAQTKKLKRPKNRVGISSVDNFVQESFDLYDKVYKYDSYVQSGKPLEDEDIDVLEDALEDVTRLSESAPDIIGDLDGVGVLKQGKATLQVNRAKKALKYCIKTAKELLLGQRKPKDKEDREEKDDNSNSDKEQDDNKDVKNESEDKKEPLDVSDGLEAYSKYDFVPGDKVLFFDDFSQDFIGDFPSKWNTNGSGEIIRTNKVEGNWFELKSGYGIYYIPDINTLPEDYTIEFDILAFGLSQNTSSTSRLEIILSDNDEFYEGKEHHAKASLPFGQFGAFDIKTNNYFNRTGGKINSSIKADIRKAVKNQPHISISVTKKRYRLWVNETKYVDIPRFIEVANALNFVKFHINGFKDGEERIFIRNLKIAEGGVDLRRKLISEGKVSTNGILFDSGSANLQPQSLGIIRQISQVLTQDESIKLKIVGHTDSDGSDEANLKLSKARSEAVKDALINIYKISEDRLSTEGKGEAEPVADNNTTNGKSQNRRVEFIKT